MSNTNATFVVDRNGKRPYQAAQPAAGAEHIERKSNLTTLSYEHVWYASSHNDDLLVWVQLYVLRAPNTGAIRELERTWL